MKRFMILITAIAAAYLSMPQAAAAQDFSKDTLWTRDLTPEASYASRFTPDGKYVIASVGKTICKFDALTGDLVFRSMDTTENIIKRIDFSNIFSKIITWSSWDMVINIWDSSLENIIKKLDYKTIKGKGATCMAISRDDKYLLIGLNIENTGNLLIYELDKDQEVKSTNVTGRLLEVVFSPDGKYFVTASLDYNEMEKYQYSHLYLWKTENWEFVQELGYLKDKVINLNFSPDGSLLACAIQTQPLLILDMNSKKLIKEYDPTEQGAFYYNRAAFSYDNKYIFLAANSFNPLTKIWDLINDTLIYKYSYPSVYGLELSVNNQYLLAGGAYQICMLKPKWGNTDITNNISNSFKFNLYYNTGLLSLEISIIKPCYANLTVYNLNGNKIDSMDLGYLHPGIHKVTKPMNLPIGVYFATIKYGSDSISKQFEVVR